MGAEDYCTCDNPWPCPQANRYERCPGSNYHSRKDRWDRCPLCQRLVLILLDGKFQTHPARQS